MIESMHVDRQCHVVAAAAYSLVDFRVDTFLFHLDHKVNNGP